MRVTIKDAVISRLLWLVDRCGRQTLNLTLFVSIGRHSKSASCLSVTSLIPDTKRGDKHESNHHRRSDSDIGGTNKSEFAPLSKNSILLAVVYAGAYHALDVGTPN
jgi:hypothetical protein